MGLSIRDLNVCAGGGSRRIKYQYHFMYPWVLSRIKIISTKVVEEDQIIKSCSVRVESPARGRYRVEGTAC